jgi:5-methylcytosine-specific restriction enzyme subunit McrC
MQLPLTEYGTTPAVTMTVEQRDQLRRVAPSIGISPAMGQEHAYDLTPGSFVGAVHLPEGLELLIQPKLPIERVLFLISYAVALGRWKEMGAHFEQADSLLEAIIPGYTFQLRRALSRGVLQGYRTDDEALPTVRGRWRIGDQVRNHFGIAPPVEVSFDEFTEDIELNRLLRAGIRRLLRVPVRDDQSRWPLRALDAKLELVRPIDYDPRRVPEPIFDRRSERYRPAVSLARLILSGASFDLGPGGVQASAFLIDMNRVFEDFVVVALREALGASDRVLVQGARNRSLHFDVGARISLQPDLSFWDGGRCTWIGDVKYKRLKSDVFPNADLYQMAAYVIATDLSRGMLIYAAGDEEPITHELLNLGVHLEVVTLDLAGSPDSVLAQIAALADRIRTQTARRTISRAS